VHSFLTAIYAGGTMIIQRRWDPLEAASLVERHRCTHWDNVPTMVVDLLSHPEALKHDITSLKWIFGGGAAMPEAIAQKLFDLCGVRYIEGYGMTETISQTHINPPQNPKKQCLGIPAFDTEALVIDPDTPAAEVNRGMSFPAPRSPPDRRHVPASVSRTGPSLSHSDPLRAAANHPPRRHPPSRDCYTHSRPGSACPAWRQ